MAAVRAPIDVTNQSHHTAVCSRRHVGRPHFQVRQQKVKKANIERGNRIQFIFKQAPRTRRLVGFIGGHHLKRPSSSNPRQCRVTSAFSKYSKQFIGTL